MVYSSHPRRLLYLCLTRTLRTCQCFDFLPAPDVVRQRVCKAQCGAAITAPTLPSVFNRSSYSVPGAMPPAKRQAMSAISKLRYRTHEKGAMFLASVQNGSRFGSFSRASLSLNRSRWATQHRYLAVISYGAFSRHCRGVGNRVGSSRCRTTQQAVKEAFWRLDLSLSRHNLDLYQ